MATENCGFLIIESNSEPMKPTILEYNKDDVVIEADLQDAEAGNRNRRVYSFEAIDSAIRSPQVQEKLKRKSFFGEAGRVAIHIRNDMSKLS